MRVAACLLANLAVDNILKRIDDRGIGVEMIKSVTIEW